MLCSDTSGKLPAIHLSREIIELAEELQPALAAIRAYGTEGSITLKVMHGHIPAIEWAVRKLRGKKAS